MKKHQLVFLFLAAFTSGISVYTFHSLQKVSREIAATKKAIACLQNEIADMNTRLDKIERQLSELSSLENELVYIIASDKTGCPVWILRGIQYAESSYGENVAHPDPWDRGEFGLHEKPSYHAERAAKWGEYDPEDRLQAAIIAGRIIMENLHRSKSIDVSISAYRRGMSGTRKNGIDRGYVDKVKRGGRSNQAEVAK